MDKLKELYNKYREIFWYLVMGGVTTVVDVATFWVTNTTLGLHYQIANIIAWVFAVTIAFVGNKLLVFRTHTKGAGALIGEIVRFFGARLATLLVSIVFMYAAVDVLHVDETVAKIISTIVVLVLNYVLSKLLVFRKKDQDPT